MKIKSTNFSEDNLFNALLSVNVGWSHEPHGKEGISHFLEHALFLGNEKYPDPDDTTSKYGVILNGQTLPERTVFYFSAIREDAPDIIDVLLSLVFEPRFLEEKVYEEKKSKIIPAIVKESDYYPWELAYEWAKNMVFEWDFRSSMGTEHSLDNMGIHEIEEWHRKYYHGANATLLLSESLDLNISAPNTGSLPKRQRKKYEEREKILDRKVGNAEIVYGFPFKRYTYDKLLLSIILGNYPTSLLWRTFHKDAYMVESRVEWHEWGGFFIYLGANSRNYNIIRRKFENFIEHLHITTENLNIAKKIATIELIEMEKSANSLVHLLQVDPKLQYGGYGAILEGIQNAGVSEIRDLAGVVLDMGRMRNVIVL